jgi:hypothetical protein
MLKLTGATAKVTEQISALNALLIEAKLFNTEEAITNENLALMQWQTGSILSNSALRLTNVPAFASMNDLRMDFVSNPELKFSDSNLDLT